MTNDPTEVMEQLQDLIDNALRKCGERGMRPPFIMCVISPNGSILASMANGDSAIRLWTARDGRLRQTLTVSNVSYWGGMAFSPDGALLVSADDAALRLWDMTTGTLLQTLKLDADQVVFSPNGHTIAVSTRVGERCIRLWSLP